MKTTVTILTEDNTRRPDLPEGTSYRVIQDHGDTMQVEILGASYPHRITKAQAVVQLEIEGKLSALEAILQQADTVTKLKWEHSHFLSMFSPFCQNFATALELDLMQFFSDASKIEM
jgi:hypothetical protein